MERKSNEIKPFKAEFVRRLTRLFHEIDKVLMTGKLYSLLPCLASVLSYLWSHQDSSYLYNKNYHD